MHFSVLIKMAPSPFDGGPHNRGAAKARGRGEGDSIEKYLKTICETFEKKRDEWLKRRGYKILGFWDNEVLQDEGGGKREKKSE